MDAGKKNLLTPPANGSTLLSVKREQPSRQFDKPLQVRVTPEQKEHFGEAAKASGLSLSAWARARLIQAARRDLKQTEGA
ncbi:MAG: toxin-antitoxin system HicB family antitoxin [Candidatus Methylomirabilota bacterium]